MVDDHFEAIQFEFKTIHYTKHSFFNIFIDKTLRQILFLLLLFCCCVKMRLIETEGLYA